MKRGTCKYSGTCSGCEWIQKPFDDQVKLKTQDLRELWMSHGLSANDLSSLDFVKTSEFRSRDRVDLTAKTINGNLTVGLYDVSKKVIVDLEECPQMSVELEKWYLDFRKTIPKIEIGSFRLRISPNGRRGVWLDLPNLTVKEFLDEGKWFRVLLEHAEVEVGQKRKKLKLVEEKLKLVDPELGPWFQSYAGEDLAPINLNMLIGGFSQPSFETNKKLISTISEFIRNANAKRWLELGSGSGNLTFALASLVESVVAVEIDELAIEGLRATIEQLDKSHLAGRKFLKRVQTHIMNFHKPSEKLKELIENSEGMLVDPPRSGLGGTLDVLRNLSINERPKSFLYVSCFPKSFVEDSKTLIDLGYSLKQISIVDQFPQSSHYEVAARFYIDSK